MTKPDSPAPLDYSRFIAELKERIQSARIAAARAVNCELILLYWDIGRAIVDKQKAPERRQEILSQAVRELVAAIPWGHHANVLASVRQPPARLYYLLATARFAWSRNVLPGRIETKS